MQENIANQNQDNNASINYSLEPKVSTDKCSDALAFLGDVWCSVVYFLGRGGLVKPSFKRLHTVEGVPR